MPGASRNPNSRENETMIKPVKIQCPRCLPSLNIMPDISRQTAAGTRQIHFSSG
jgi:hypothetical protein